MAEAFIGEVRLVPYNFAPRGWAFCAGQLLSIAQNDALFALLGTTYGGDGQTTFGLPDLRGRVPIHQSSTMLIGAVVGSESVTLTTNEMAAHGHQLHVAGVAGTQTAPGGNYLGSASSKTLGKIYADTGDTTMAPSGFAGGNQPHENRQPFLVLNYVICLEGIFPSQN